jgi:hypothetical protein
MKRHHLLLLVTMLVFFPLTLGTSGCFLPCITSGCKPEGRLDGTWRLSTVNARAISSYQPGYPVRNTNDYIWGGDLDFYTGRWDGDMHWGSVTIQFFVKNSLGIQQQSGRFSGTFAYDKSTGEITLQANGRSLVVKVSGNTITAAGGLPRVEEIAATFVRLTSE